MRTNIEIDDEVLEEARRLTGLTIKREIVDYALRELVARQRRHDILTLRDDDEAQRGQRHLRAFPILR